MEDFQNIKENKILNISKRKSRLPLKTKQKNRYQNGIKILTGDQDVRRKWRSFILKGINFEPIFYHE